MRRLLASLLCALALQATTSAHALDEYVQAAQVAVAPEGVRVTLRLTPGVFVAEQVFALIDADGDGQLSRVEEEAYARRVLQDVALEVDERRLPLALEEFEFPSRREMQDGVGAIRLDLGAEAPLRAAGEHRLTFRSNHLPGLGVYLVNALIPTTDEIKLGSLERDPLQRELRLSFQVAPQVTRGARTWAGVLLLCLCPVLFLNRLRRRKTVRI